MQYADLLEDVLAGHVVAVAPAVNADGRPILVIVRDELAPLHREMLSDSSCEQRAQIAMRAVRQVRQHYGLWDACRPPE